MKALKIAISTLALAGFAPFVFATDPPHNTTRSIECVSCHQGHTAPGGTITRVKGNANLCMSCHTPGGPAAAYPFASPDQGAPSPGLPAGVSATGNSHRWDSGASGRVAVDAANSSTGLVESGGAYTGVYAKAYTITITTAGNVGVARFDWSATTPGGGSGTNVLTAAGVALDQGITVAFTNGAGTSFQLNDEWYVYVRPDINQPTSGPMAARISNGKIMCSTCHDQHSQSRQPFDPAAPAYAGRDTGAGRHFQRIANDAGQMCLDCHSARAVASATAGSHPVGVVVPGGDFQPPVLLPLDPSGKVQCLTCHVPHFGPATDGTLRRVVNVTSLCSDCHTLADTSTPGSHLDSLNTRTLWPGGQYGTTFPPMTDTVRRGACTNCHQPHGWPDTALTSQDYPTLLVDREENLCYTCHDTDGPSLRRIRPEFSKASAHPVGLASGTHDSGESAVVNSPDRHVECVDCHNTHQAKPRVNLPGPTTTARPASGPLAGVRGVDKTNSEVDPTVYEYEVCFRCHGDSTGKPAAPTARQFPQTNVRLEFEGSYPSFHPVAAVGKNPDVPSLKAGYATNSRLSCTSCHNNNNGPAAGGTGPNGPHGSANPSLLELRYDTNDGPGFSEARFALCFKCHEYTESIRRDDSFGEHRRHIDNENTPCNVCHDPHASSGNPKLINFDTDVVSPFNGTIEFRSTGLFTGWCTLTCHGEPHNARTYAP